MVPAFIICRDRLTWTRDLAEQCVRLGLCPVLVDNASTYPPLLAWYDGCPFEVIRLDRNHGHRVVWTQKVERTAKDWYVVTDHDLDLAGVPGDALDRLKEEFLAHPQVNKAGFSLEVADVPDKFPLKRGNLNIEAKYWRRRLGRGWDAPIDTTFALYHRRRARPFFQAIRLDRPYTARHLPWYLGIDDVTEEERYYLDRANRSSHCYGRNG